MTFISIWYKFISNYYINVALIKCWVIFESVGTWGIISNWKTLHQIWRLSIGELWWWSRTIIWCIVTFSTGMKVWNFKSIQVPCSKISHCMYTSNCTVIRYNDNRVVNLLHVSAILREASNKENYIKASYNIDVQ